MPCQLTCCAQGLRYLQPRRPGWSCEPRSCSSQATVDHSLTRLVPLCLAAVILLRLPAALPAALTLTLTRIFCTLQACSARPAYGCWYSQVSGKELPQHGCVMVDAAATCGRLWRDHCRCSAHCRCRHHRRYSGRVI